MFATPASLEKRTGKTGLFRGAYLKQLVEEYESLSQNDEKRLQVLANLGNFAYDPINYEYFRRFKVIDLFMNALREGEEIRTNCFALGAICNLCLDPKNKELLIANNIFELISACLTKRNLAEKISTLDEYEIELAANALMTFMFLLDETNKSAILANESLIEFIRKSSVSIDKRLANLANLFLQDYCAL